jgi:hypothetical protein
MKRIFVTDKDLADPREAARKVNQLYEQQFALLERLAEVENSLRSGKGVVGGLSEQDRMLLKAMSVGSTENPVAAQKPVIPTVNSLPPVSTATPGEMVHLSSDGLVYRYDGILRSWQDIGAAAPANMMTTDTNQIPGATVVKTWTAQQVLNGGLLAGALVDITAGGLRSAAGVTVTAGQFDSASQMGCAVYNSVAQSIPNTTASVLTFDTEMYDVGGCFDPASPSRITVPVGGGGRWIFVAHVSWATNVTGQRLSGLLGTINGAPVTLALDYKTPVTGFTSTHTIVSPPLELVDGDYFTVSLYQNSGGALNVNGSIGVTDFAGYKLC